MANHIWVWQPLSLWLVCKQVSNTRNCSTCWVQDHVVISSLDLNPEIKRKKKEKVCSQSGYTLNCLTALHYDFTDAAGLNFWRRVIYYSPLRNWRETKRTSSRYCLLSKFSCSPFISLWAIHNWLFTSMLVKVAVFRLFLSPRIIVNKVWYIQKAFQWSVISNTYSSVKFLY